MATTQKVVAVLRKAGLPIAKYEASHMIRGWGDWTPGYQVRKYGDAIRVNHDKPSALQKAHDALRAAGLTIIETGTEFARWLEVR